MLNESFRSDGPEATRTWAAAFARTLAPGVVLALHGDLGAGKTCLVSGLASGLGVTDHVHSPTFALVHEYAGRIPLYHLDLYRINHVDEAIEMGIDHYLTGDGICAIEWPERIAGLLPASTIHIYLQHGEEPEERRIALTPVA